MDLDGYECDCGDWTSKRFLFGDDSPGRLCRCLVIALRQPDVEADIPRLDWNTKLFQLLDYFTETEGCFDAYSTWKLLRCEAANGSPPGIASGASSTPKTTAAHLSATVTTSTNAAGPTVRLRSEPAP